MQSPPLNDQYERDVAPLVPKEWPGPPLHAPARLSGSENDELGNGRPSIGRRMFRLLVAALIGVGATLAWQSYGDEAKEAVRTWAPSLAWLLPVSTVGQSSAQDASLPRPIPAAAATSAEVVQQLEPMARDLAALRRSLEQLAAKQEQMAQNIAALQAAEQDIGQRMASPPAPRAVPTPPRRPPQPAAQSSAVPSSSAPPPQSPGQPPLPLR
jgi:hypothetical protein